jgi:hypothetical protein
MKLLLVAAAPHLPKFPPRWRRNFALNMHLTGI